MSDLAIYRIGSVVAATGFSALAVAAVYALRLWWQRVQRSRDAKWTGRDPRADYGD